MNSLSFALFKNEELIYILIASVITAAFCTAVFHLINSRAKRKLPRETLFVCLIVLIYSVVSFTKLGSTKFPSSTWEPTTTPQEVILKVGGDSSDYNDILVICGEGDNNANNDYQLGFHDIAVVGSRDLEEWTWITSFNDGDIYRYYHNEYFWNYPYVKIISSNKDDTISEIAFLDKDRNPLPVTVYDDPEFYGKHPASTLIDEQDTIPNVITYYHESFFDEIYHPRNAWEIANGQGMYYTVHPLLGTEIMALSIKIFGMNPFAWRFPGALFGVAIPVVFYHILKFLTDNPKTAIFGTFLVACDFMHITTSRMATLEPPSVFFILLMFDFMIQYSKTSFFEVSFNKTLCILLICGITMGLAISTKWTACYSAVGLALILFGTLFVRGREYFDWVKSGGNIEVPNGKAVSQFPIYFLKTILWCFVFFIFIPVVIYALVYLPVRFSWKGWGLESIVDQTIYMFDYHKNLTDTHPFQSVWWEWVLNLRPVLYYSNFCADGLFRVISCFTNPLLSYAGILSILATFVIAFLKRTRAALIISVGYLTALVPWMFISRSTFAYHFYPTSMFMIMAIAYIAQFSLGQWPQLKPFWIVFAVLVLLIFIVSLPVICGFGTSVNYVKARQLLPRWTLK